MYSPSRFSQVSSVLSLAAAFMLVAFQTRAVDDDSDSTSTAAHAAPNQPRSSAVENSVVKVFSTVRYPDPYKPWTKQAPTDYTSSGIIIEGRRVLCNAHAVLYASEVQVQPNQAGDKISATVVAVSPGIDLALLKLDDETCFESRPPA